MVKNMTIETLIAKKLITPVFQGIVDLMTGRVLGYEVLSRGAGELTAPDVMFAAAREQGLVWDLEYACREAAFRVIASLPAEYQRHNYFINVSPNIFSDVRFGDDFTHELLAQYGLKSKRIVFEITEEETIVDYDRFERLVSHFAEQGYRIALDDFGSGHSGLSTLIAAAPHFIKLDKRITQNLAENAYTQLLLKSVTSLATNLDTCIIAEGVERIEELHILARHGVRYAQGFLLQKPQPFPEPISELMVERLNRISMQYNYTRTSLNKSLVNLVVKADVFEEGSLLCQDLEEIFRNNPKCDLLAFVKDKQPSGLVTREHYFLQTGGRFGFSLYQHKPASTLYKDDMLIVNEKMSITALSKLVMDRDKDCLYDPVLVTNDDQELLGLVTIKQLLARATELQIQGAMGANPLTNLPGNRAIQEWIESLRGMQSFAIIYGDLDRFKEYNDAFGFVSGDDMLRLTARIMADNLHLAGEGARLGHIGGDDFIITVPHIDPTRFLEATCRDFDNLKRSLFDHDTLRKGKYWVTNRAGVRAEVQLVTLSLAVVNNQVLSPNFHMGILGKIAASLKKKTKQLSARSGRSNYLFERRINLESETLDQAFG